MFSCLRKSIRADRRDRHFVVDLEQIKNAFEDVHQLAQANCCRAMLPPTAHSVFDSRQRRTL
jgi:hypothetical protein